MEIDPGKLNTRDMYQWMIQTIIPRPIAWVSTLSPGGVKNLAPFSFFAGICARPPTLMFCPVNDRFGNPKDTLRNMEATGEAVVHIVSHKVGAAMNDSAASLPPEVSEFEKFRIAEKPALKVKPPRVAEALVAYECVLDRIVRISEGPAGGNAVFCRIVHLHVADEVIGLDGLVDPVKLDPLGRLSGDYYTRLGERFTLERPE
ncbi:MAG TPA: flavin reductase family protein [Candidatus Limnocylindria bacterium]|jgi:flavin reductase (DIM6/NTAB) family NADH-FMN oxidoreductase RutF|nr:flavin reductase family protein [Candidatus Limnocylindria bacterium]